MKRIFLLMLIMGAFSSLINAYEIEVYRNINENSYRLFIDYHRDFLQLKYIQNGNIAYYNESNSRFWGVLNTIQKTRNNENFNNGYGYVSRNTFDSLLKENKELLNDFYIEATQQILNYYYNNSNFTNTGYKIYNNYQILYDVNGLAVESIVNDVWAGLYSDSEKGVSGRLYSSGGQLLYVNGKPLNWMESQLIKLMDMVDNSLRETVDVLGSLVPVIVAVVFVLLILYYVVSVGRRAIMPSNVKVRKRFLGSHNDEC